MGRQHMPRIMRFLKNGKLKAVRSRRGNALIEFSLMMPWYVFLFIGTFDFGFYAYSLIATQSAARVAALYCATSSATATDSSTACSYALDQLRNLPNVGYSMSTCDASPLTVTASTWTGPDSNSGTSVLVTYTTPQLIPIPGILPGQLTINRTVKMPLRG
jgi:Flp pilus assembly protein TadG